MNPNPFSYALRASADVIDVNLLARGVVNLITFHRPSKATLEGLKKLKPNDKISGMELMQVVNGQIHSEVVQRDFEAMAFFPDVLQRGTVYHLLLKDVDLVPPVNVAG